MNCDWICENVRSLHIQFSTLATYLLGMMNDTYVRSYIDINLKLAGFIHILYSVIIFLYHY